MVGIVPFNFPPNDSIESALMSSTVRKRMFGFESAMEADAVARTKERERRRYIFVEV